MNETKLNSFIVQLSQTAFRVKRNNIGCISMVTDFSPNEREIDIDFTKGTKGGTSDSLSNNVENLKDPNLIT